MLALVSLDGFLPAPRIINSSVDILFFYFCGCELGQDSGSNFSLASLMHVSAKHIKNMLVSTRPISGIANTIFALLNFGFTDSVLLRRERNQLTDSCKISPTAVIQK